MNILGWFQTTEADVMKFITKVWNEEKVLAAEIVAVVGWVRKTGLPALNADIAAIMPIVGLLGDVTGHPELGPQVAALNMAVAQINAFANSNTKLDADSVVNGVAALNAATAAVKQVGATSMKIIAAAPAVKVA